MSASNGKLKTALALRRRGYWPVLIYPNPAGWKPGEKSAKNPIGEKWGLEQWTVEKIETTARDFPGAGAGICFGPSRGPRGSWLIDLEGDGPEAGESLGKLLGGELVEVDTPSWSSTRGSHTIFVADGERLLRLLAAAGAKEGTGTKSGVWKLPELPGLEFRIGGFKSDGSIKQVQSVCPPTIGDDGNPRGWIVQPTTPPASLPEAACVLLEAIAAGKVQKVESSAGDCTTKEPGHRPMGRGRNSLARYAQSALESECAAVEAEPQGNRNNRLNTAAFSIGQLVGARVLVRSEVEAPLLESARRAGLGERESIATIRSGLNDGEANPRNLSNVGTRFGKYGEPPSGNGDGHHGAGDGRDDFNAKLAKRPKTDTGNAERMVARHGSAIRHCHPWKKWLHFDGRRWVVDDVAKIHQSAKATARKILAEAGTIEDKARRGSLVKWARQAESRSRLTAMIALAAVEEGIPISPDDLDADPWLLNVQNGTIDLRTGELRSHRREDFITRMAPVAFDPHARCPLWDSTLLKIFDKNADLIAFWDRLCGLSLTGVTYEQILPILWGKGSNGKSTLVKTLVGLLGPELAMIAPPGLLMVKRNEAHPTERATLFGKRLIVEMETEEDVRLNENLIKHLTGGDSITTRRMNEDFWTFDPTHKLWLCTNHRPVIKGTDHAIWRRPKLVPFTVTIPDAEQILDMTEKLKYEYHGILRRCVRGCLDWQRSGLGVPKEVTEATKGYRDEQDTLAGFLAEDCLEGASYRTKSTPLYAEYRSRTERLGENPMSHTAFGIAMKERGFEKVSNNGIWYLGIGLRSALASAKPATQNDGNQT